MNATRKVPQPDVSIILPTFNRAGFLPQAFASIAGQTFGGWELIVVDDGSTDDTQGVCRLHRQAIPGLRLVTQENQGAYAARATGLRHAAGRYIAFFDSDDQWLPHHLARCVEALDRNADVDWVYGASRIVDGRSGRVTTDNTFYMAGEPRPFLSLRTEPRGDLRVFAEPDLISRILYGSGLFAGLQNSVVRRTVFERVHLDAISRNEAEDQVFVIRALAAGVRFGYFNDVHHLYYVHQDNSSGSALSMSPAKRIRIYTDLIAGFERLPDQVALTAAQRKALRAKLSHEYFWHLGYSALWPAGQRRKAFGAYWRAIRLTPWRLSYWKTLAVAAARTVTAPFGAPQDPHTPQHP